MVEATFVPYRLMVLACRPIPAW